MSPQHPRLAHGSSDTAFQIRQTCISASIHMYPFFLCSLYMQTSGSLIGPLVCLQCPGKRCRLFFFSFGVSVQARRWGSPALGCGRKLRHGGGCSSQSWTRRMSCHALALTMQLPGSRTGAGRAIAGCPLGASGRHGPHSIASGAALLLLLPALCKLREVICCREWGFSGAA